LGRNSHYIAMHEQIMSSVLMTYSWKRQLNLE